MEHDAPESMQCLFCGLGPANHTDHGFHHSYGATGVVQLALDITKMQVATGPDTAMASAAGKLQSLVKQQHGQRAQGGKHMGCFVLRGPQCDKRNQSQNTHHCSSARHR